MTIHLAVLWRSSAGFTIESWKSTKNREHFDKCQREGIAFQASRSLNNPLADGTKMCLRRLLSSAPVDGEKMTQLRLNTSYNSYLWLFIVKVICDSSAWECRICHRLRRWSSFAREFTLPELATFCVQFISANKEHHELLSQDKKLRQEG